MKRGIVVCFSFFFILLCVGCTNKDAINFKREYESLNGIVNKNGKAHRTVSIPKDNPYEKVDAKTILEKMEKKESFYVYFGDKLCPWCRSVIEKSIEIAKKNKVSKIYYVAIWNDDGEEIIRDKYALENGELKKLFEGTKEYQTLIDVFNELLSDYTLTNETGEKISVGEKRIYAPNFIYVEDGIPKSLITGISEKQTDSREELTNEILMDEQEQFETFFQKKS